MAKLIFIYILLLGILATSCFSLYYVVKYKEIYSNEPLVYGAKDYDIDSCLCMTKDGNTLTFNQTAVVRQIKQSVPSMNHAPVNTTLFEESISK